MSEHNEAFPIEGLRRIEVRLHRGDVRIARISGDVVELDGESALSAEVRDGTLFIRGGDGQHRERKHHEPNAAWRFSRGDLGASIGQIVTDAVDSIFKAELWMGGLGAAAVRVGIPASLERPEIVVSTGSGDIEMRGVSADAALQSHSGDVEVADCSGALQVTTGMGDLSVASFDGPVTGRTGSGDARFERCARGGVIHTGSGDVEASQVTGAWKLYSGAGDVKVDVLGEAAMEIVTGAGDVTVRKGALALLTVQSGSGDVECTSLLTGSRHQMQTGNGDITVAIADPPGARLQILTRNGDVNSEYPLVSVGKQGRHSHGGGRYVGNIGDSEIDLELRTASGDISIRRREPGVIGDAATRERRAEPTQTPAPEDYSAWPAPSSGLGFPPAPPAPPAPPFAAAGADEHGYPTDAEAPPIETHDRRTVVETGGNPRLAVLENLQAGKLSVAEAARLLEALSQHGA